MNPPMGPGGFPRLSAHCVLNIFRSFMFTCNASYYFQLTFFRFQSFDWYNFHFINFQGEFPTYLDMEIISELEASTRIVNFQNFSVKELGTTMAWAKQYQIMRRLHLQLVQNQVMAGTENRSDPIQDELIQQEMTCLILQLG